MDAHSSSRLGRQSPHLAKLQDGQTVRFEYVAFIYTSSKNLANHICQNVVMLDTRNYDRSITTLDWNDDYIEELKDDAGRSLMGSAQENWFYRSLSESQNRGATWRIIGNQIIFSRMNNSAVYGNYLNADQWDVSSLCSS
jgi:hypothetical protein